MNVQTQADFTTIMATAPAYLQQQFPIESAHDGDVNWVIWEMELGLANLVTRRDKGTKLIGLDDNITTLSLLIYRLSKLV
jgi:hypothetical protein